MQPRDPGAPAIIAVPLDAWRPSPDRSGTSWPTPHDLLVTELADIRREWSPAAEDTIPGEAAVRSLVGFIRERAMPHAGAEETAALSLRGHPMTDARSWRQREHEEIRALSDELERVAASGVEHSASEPTEPLDEWLAATFPASDPLPGPTTIGGSGDWSPLPATGLWRLSAT